MYTFDEFLKEKVSEIGVLNIGNGPAEYPSLIFVCENYKVAFIPVNSNTAIPKFNMVKILKITDDIVFISNVKFNEPQPISGALFEPQTTDIINCVNINKNQKYAGNMYKIMSLSIENWKVHLFSRIINNFVFIDYLVIRTDDMLSEYNHLLIDAKTRKIIGIVNNEYFPSFDILMEILPREIEHTNPIMIDSEKLKPLVDANDKTLTPIKLFRIL